MADQRRWFKLWCTALDDPSLGVLPLEDFARWVKVGAYLAVHGDHGVVVLPVPPDGVPHPLQSALHEVTFTAMMRRIKTFPNCDVVERYGDPVTWTITWRNWRRYQEETSWERMQRYRDKRVTAKRRGEERRREEKRSKPPLAALPHAPTVTSANNGIVFHIPVSIAAALKRAPRLGQAPALHAPAYWQAELRANPGVEFGDEILKAEAWMTANPDKAPKKNFPRFLHNWLGRADRPPEEE